MNNHRNEIANWLTEGIPEEQLKIEKALAVISAKIYTKRTKMGMGQKEFAKYMGVSQGMISRWESGTYNFSISTLIGICEKLGLTFDPQISEKELNTQNTCFIRLRSIDNTPKEWVDWKPNIGVGSRKVVA